MELTQEYAEQYMNNAIEEFHEIFLNKGFDPLSERSGWCLCIETEWENDDGDIWRTTKAADNDPEYEGYAKKRTRILISWGGPGAWFHVTAETREVSFGMAWWSPEITVKVPEDFADTLLSEAEMWGWP